MSKVTITLLRYEWIAFTRNTFQIVMLGCTFLLGLYSIYYGQSEIKVQRDTIQDVMEIEKTEFHQYQASFKEELASVTQKKKLEIASDAAYAWHRHGYHAILHPHDYAALAIGQCDLHPYYYRLTGMSLHYQLFENEIANPVKLYVGNFDLSFVLIYLFPLLIIAFSYGLYSGEKESGVLPLLHIQTVNIRRIIIVRLILYFFLITGLALLISMIGLTTSGNIMNSENSLSALFWILSVIMYCAFWFAVLFFIVSFKMNSSFTAITAAGVWLLFLIIIPAVLNVWVTTRYPLDSTSLAEITRRTSLENEEDQNEAKEVIQEFLAHNPHLQGSDSLIHNNTLAKAYAALTSLKDMHSKEDVDQYNNQVYQRNKWISDFHWVNPAVNMQSIFIHIAKTDLNTFHQFHTSIESFHRNISNFYFQKLFWDKPIRREDYSRLPSFKIKTDEVKWSTLILLGIVKVSIATILFFGIGFTIMKKKKI
ncbi:DUF3526 domain-containing protein [Aquimarina megaterium]|uniref:DUF3526 domain-containing protein n=1 Tax=Aquimarina megaterium TaxID=1443666 RepID=UPI000942CB8A|nr:DUF3526 domain-containing protein [Aquimarina megaterium]